MIKTCLFANILLLPMFLFALMAAAITLKAQTRNEGPWWTNKLWGANDQPAVLTGLPLKK
ncbi:MAG TPA: hypothetical protein VFD56_11445 [Chitinophagaceae bacterium]|nr:hypothetical protein [Chitinophagaceae bacterium]